jgi:hypothetical protein
MQLLILALAAMAVVVASRLIRVRLGRSPKLEGPSRLLFILGLLLVPPIALGALTQPSGEPSTLGAFAMVPLYVVTMVGLGMAMWVAALVVSVALGGRPRRLLLLALVGRHGNPDDIPRNPPLTAVLVESLAKVAATNRAFARGTAFPDEVVRPGFRGDWDALEAATRTLEGQIRADVQNGLGVGSPATAAAEDARSRLNMLRRLAVEGGQAWAG